MDVNAAMGKVGLPAPLAELAARDWDAVVVGGGHNGLTAAAYLAKAGRSVLVLERREQLGGACTLEQPFEDPGYLVSPCAYVVGLLDERVVRELGLRGRGYRVFMTEPGRGARSRTGPPRGVQRRRAHAVLPAGQGFPASEIEGVLAYEGLFDRGRVALRKGERDSWLGSSPTAGRARGDAGTTRSWSGSCSRTRSPRCSTATCSDERLRSALCGQGVIGAWAGPARSGHRLGPPDARLGELEGRGGAWGYVEGGMGQISFAIAQAAQDAGAQLAAGVPVARILPGEGVELESGELIRARAVISNADPKRVLGMLDGDEVPPEFRSRLEAWKVRSPVIKLNAALSRCPLHRRVGARRGGRGADQRDDQLQRGRRRDAARRSRRASAASPRSASRSSTSRPRMTRASRPRASRR